MALSVKNKLADRDVHPSAEHLKKIETKWQEIIRRRGDLDGVALDDADIAVRNIPGGDHVR